jgi:hypoxanthine phosphoribosyltransferase
VSAVGPIALDADAIGAAVAELARQIVASAEGVVVLLPLLPEGAPLCRDLVAEISARGVSVDVDPIRVTRLSPDAPRATLERPIGLDLAGRDVVVIAAVVDTGMRLRFALSALEGEGARSLSVCALLDRPDRRLVDLPLLHVGFTVPDCLFAGYGLGRDVGVACGRSLHYVDAATAERARRRHLSIV